jgi:hypothetical protein
MTSTTLDDKIRSVFGEFAVDKGLIRRMTGRTSAEKTLSVAPAWREILAPCIDFHAENRPAVSKLLVELERLS